MVIVNNNIAVAITTSSHFEYMGSTPTITGADCGTGPSVVGTDMGGTITIGTGGAASTCNIKFAQNWNFKPSCWCNNESQILVVRASATVANLTCSVAIAFGASDSIGYGCLGRR